MKERGISQDMVKTHKNRVIISCQRHSSSSSSSSGANRADSSVQHRRKAKQDVDMNKDDKEISNPMEEKSNVTVSRNKEK